MATPISYEGFDEPEDEAPRPDYSSYDTGGGMSDYDPFSYDASGTSSERGYEPSDDTEYEATSYDASGNYTGGSDYQAPTYDATSYDASGNYDYQPASPSASTYQPSVTNPYQAATAWASARPAINRTAPGANYDAQGNFGGGYREPDLRNALEGAERPGQPGPAGTRRRQPAHRHRLARANG